MSSQRGIFNYRLSARQARRLGLQAGTLVKVQLRTNAEKPKSLRNKRIAKNVWAMDGTLITTTLGLED